jgi:hypothetical protein
MDLVIETQMKMRQRNDNTVDAHKLAEVAIARSAGMVKKATLCAALALESNNLVFYQYFVQQHTRHNFVGICKLELLILMLKQHCNNIILYCEQQSTLFTGTTLPLFSTHIN